MERNIPKTLRMVFRPGHHRGSMVPMIVEKVLLEEMRVEVSDIYAIQDFPALGVYDVTFFSEETCLLALDMYERKKGTGVFADLDITAKFMTTKREVIVHCYNPFLEPVAIKMYLKRFCIEVDDGFKLKNAYQIYRSKIKFRVRFNRNEKGITYPPPYFTIAGERCTLFFPGQPQFCNRCHDYGHSRFDCTAGEKCRLCGSLHHVARDCDGPRRCDFCNGEGHYARECSQKGDRRIYSEAVRFWGSKSTRGHAQTPRGAAGRREEGGGEEGNKLPVPPPPRVNPVGEAAEDTPQDEVAGETGPQSGAEEGNPGGFSELASSPLLERGDAHSAQEEPQRVSEGVAPGQADVPPAQEEEAQAEELGPPVSLSDVEDALRALGSDQLVQSVAEPALAIPLSGEDGTASGSIPPGQKSKPVKSPLSKSSSWSVRVLMDPVLGVEIPTSVALSTSSSSDESLLPIVDSESKSGGDSGRMHDTVKTGKAARGAGSKGGRILEDSDSSGSSLSGPPQEYKKFKNEPESSPGFSPISGSLDNSEESSEMDEESKEEGDATPEREAEVEMD